MTRPERLKPTVKPRLRGLSHLLACVLAVVAGLALLDLAPTLRAKFASAVYTASLAVMFGSSALYHCPTWSPDVRKRLRRLDHASIFVYLGGSYTPFCMLALEDGTQLLVMAWAGAFLGVVQSLVWIGAPRVVSAGLYLVLGWMVVPYLPGFVVSIGAIGVMLLFVCGVAFTLGAVVYATRRPDPLPRVFGYHEIFHILVIVGCGFQYLVVWRLIASLR